MSPWFSFIISCLALLISGMTAWLAFFHNGRLLMTQPTVIFFGPDGSKFESKKNKVYRRTLLYSTAKRGQVIESLHISLHRNESRHNFNIWVYGDRGNLKRGSDLFVPQEGVTFDHHFLLPEDGANFNFHAGTYKLTIIAKLVGQPITHELASILLSITKAQAIELAKPGVGIFFDWGPDQQSYHSHVETKCEIETNLEQLLEVMANNTMQPPQQALG